MSVKSGSSSEVATMFFLQHYMSSKAVQNILLNSEANFSEFGFKVGEGGSIPATLQQVMPESHPPSDLFSTSRTILRCRNRFLSLSHDSNTL